MFDAVSLFVSLSVCQQDRGKTTGLIFMKNDIEAVDEESVRLQKRHIIFDSY